MATIESEIPVICYELPPYDPRDPSKLKATIMRPSPLERFTGRFGRKEDKRRARAMLTEAGHSVHAINWGKHPEGGHHCLVVYIWAPEAVQAPPVKPTAPTPKARRTATTRRKPPTSKKQ